MQKLWTKDFTIITVGSFVSMLGNSIAGFAMGLLVLDYTKSTLLYALYLFLFTLPKIVAPIIAGPFVDKFSRKRTIYMLDFTSAFIYAIYAFMLFTNNFNFAVLAVGCLILGTIESIYEVAYTSFYPLLIPEGNHSKAYSISSILETLTSIMVPVSVVLYKTIGMAPLFVINAVSFLIAAIMETQIKQREVYQEKRATEKFTLNRYLSDFKEGIAYLKLEKGLLAIAVYFAFASFSGAAEGVLLLPYFKNNFPNGEYIFILIIGGMFWGRLVGGSIYYSLKLPSSKKYIIALIVYITTCTLEGSFLFFSFKSMFIACFIIGIMGITSYNIRIAATQTYVPDEKKGRFNGTFQMLCTLGALLGQVTCGGLSTIINERILLSLMMFINLLAAIFIIGLNKNSISKIYNRSV